MNNDEIFFTMALTRISNFNYATALELYRAVGSAQLIFEHRHEIGDILQDCSPRLMEALKDWDEPMKRAEAELQYMQTHGIRALTLTDEDYPQRLSECPDAPIILYYKGNADLNQSRIISIVGTRHCTTYGQDIIRRFIEDLHRFCPQVLVVSGLAYGVDINAHREALANGYPTVGVLAHGLDQIYPYRHRDTAAEMLRQGGLLTVETVLWQEWQMLPLLWRVLPRVGDSSRQRLPRVIIAVSLPFQVMCLQSSPKAATISFGITGRLSSPVPRIL